MLLGAIAGLNVVGNQVPQLLNTGGQMGDRFLVLHLLPCYLSLLLGQVSGLLGQVSGLLGRIGQDRADFCHFSIMARDGCLVGCDNGCEFFGCHWQLDEN